MKKWSENVDVVVKRFSWSSENFKEMVTSYNIQTFSLIQIHMFWTEVLMLRKSAHPSVIYCTSALNSLYMHIYINYIKISISKAYLLGQPSDKDFMGKWEHVLLINIIGVINIDFKTVK